MNSNEFPFKSYIYDYIDGLGISNNAATPLTKINIFAGSCLDSTGAFQMQLPSMVTINAAVNGINGLDTGTFASHQVYSVYLVSDPVDLQSTGAMISLSTDSPKMPYGYTAHRLIGYAITNSSVANFYKGYWTASNDPTRWFYYDTARAIPLSGSGKATSFTQGNTSLTGIIPRINHTPLILQTDFIPSHAAGDKADFQGATSSGVQASITGQITTVHITGQVKILAQLFFGAPSFSYRVTNDDDTLTVSLLAFQFKV